MGRTVRWWRLTVATGCRRGVVVVATAFILPGVGSVRCPAAPLVAASIRRAGSRVRCGELVVHGADPPGDGMMCAVTWRDPGGRRYGLAAAAVRDDRDSCSLARRTIEEWAGVLRTRRVQVADVDPLCSGARRALEKIVQAVDSGGRVYVLGRPMADQDMLADLHRRGAVFVDSIDRVPAGSRVVFPAAGASSQTRADAMSRGLRVTDATCPLVESAHAATRRFAADGDTLVIIGSSAHAAADGFAGQAAADVVRVETVADVPQLTVARQSRVAFVVQTGTALEDAAPIVNALRSRWQARAPHPDSWCHAASDRAATVRTAAAGCDLVVVLGQDGTSDTQHLRQLARRECAQVHVVGSIADLSPAWLADASTVGIVAAVSAPGRLVRDNVEVLSGLGPVGVVRRRVGSQVDGYLGRPC